MLFATIFSKKKTLSLGEEALRNAKRELRSFLSGVDEIRSLEKLKVLIDHARRDSEHLSPRNRAVLCYHQLAVAAAMKRGH